MRESSSGSSSSWFNSKVDPLDPPLQQRPAFGDACEFRAGLFAQAASGVPACRNVLASQVQCLPCGLTCGFLAFEFGEALTKFGDPLRPCILSLGERCSSHIEAFTLGFTFGTCPTHKVQGFGVAGDPGFERFNVIECGALDPACSLEVSRDRRAATLGPRSFPFCDLELDAGCFESGESRAVWLRDVNTGR